MRKNEIVSQTRRFFLRYSIMLGTLLCVVAMQGYGAGSGNTVVAQWNDAALQAIRDFHPGPPMAARMIGQRKRLVCPNASIPVWPWNLEVSGVVSDDASKWTVTQTIDSQRANGIYKDSTGPHTFDTRVTSTMCPPCDPLNGYLQQTAGQKVIFYIYGPGPHMSILPGQTVDSGAWVKNFTSRFCSIMVPGSCYTKQWYVKTVISPGALLNVTASSAGYGWMSTSF